MAKLKIDIGEDHVIINGIKYSNSIFESFAEGGLNYDEPFKIIKRENGMVIIKSLVPEVGVIKETIALIGGKSK